MGDVASSLWGVEAVVRLVDASVGYSRTPAGADRLHVILTRQPTDTEHARSSPSWPTSRRRPDTAAPRKACTGRCGRRWTGER